MEALDIARRMAELGQPEEAGQAYTLALHNGGISPEEELEAAIYLLQSGGDYKTAYTTFLSLYNRGCFQGDCLSIMTQAFYQPNVKLLKTRYEKNCKALSKYPYLFRRDFPAFEDLSLCFYPFDDASYLPYDLETGKFGDYWKPTLQVVSRNFFKDLENPILAKDVYSQYELEYLNDNVRKSEYIGRENHVYLHYSDWHTFCAYLQCLNMRPLLEAEKFVFLIGDEISQYPIDFKERFGIDYSQYPVKPLGVREINKLIWHTQLSSHNGGDFFNEILDAHPNLLVLTSVMMDNMEKTIDSWQEAIHNAKGSKEAAQALFQGNPPQAVRVIHELRSLSGLSDKDIFVGIYLSDPEMTKSLDPAARIAPAVFFQPHFSNIVYTLQVDDKGRTMLQSDQYDKTISTPIFRGFKYIKTFTPLRRFTTSHGATVRFMYASAQQEPEEGEAQGVVPDAVSQRILNRSFMVDWQDRLYTDSVLVRFEDAKLNPKATFTALAAFLDIPYTESMTYCSENGKLDPTLELNGITKFVGFDTTSVYNTYDEYVNDSERKYIEYFLRDAYENYGYDFQYYDGQPVDLEEVGTWLEEFSTIDHYIEKTWRKVYQNVKVSVGDKRVEGEVSDNVQKKLLDSQINIFRQNRKRNAEILMKGLRFVNRHGQPLHMMPKLELDPALLDQPLYH